MNWHVKGQEFRRPSLHVIGEQEVCTVTLQLGPPWNMDCWSGDCRPAAIVKLNPLNDCALSGAKLVGTLLLLSDSSDFGEIKHTYPLSLRSIGSDSINDHTTTYWTLSISDEVTMTSLQFLHDRDIWWFPTRDWIDGIKFRESLEVRTCSKIPYVLK